MNLSSLFEEIPNGYEKFELGDAFEEEPERSFSDETPQDKSEGGDMYALTRFFNRSLRRAYQRQVKETNRGSPGCMLCIGDMKRQEENERQAEASASSAKDEIEVSYIYEPLLDSNSVRVLELQPASTYEAPLHALLVTETSREHARYAALSYTWTGAGTSGTLHLGVGHLTIMGNLDLALRALRPKDAVLCIWVDAVCINQQGLQEKAIQVAQMDDIYTRAESVLAWLGPASSTSSEALEFMEVLAELSKVPEYDVHVCQQPAVIELTSFSMDADNASQIHETRASTHVDELLDLTLHIGDQSIPWVQFQRELTMLWAAESTFTTVGLKVDQGGPINHALGPSYARDQLKANNDGTTLFQDYTMQVYARAKELKKWGCKDGQDRVFAIIGFIPTDSDMTIVPNYTVDASEVFIEFAREHILYEGLTILLFAGLEQRRGLGLEEFTNRLVKGLTADKVSNSIFDVPEFLEGLNFPTWVPELRPDRIRPVHRFWLPQTFNAELDRTPAVVLHKTCPHIIAVKGHIFDIITHTLPSTIVSSKAARSKDTEIMDYLQTLTYLGIVWHFSKKHYSDGGVYPTGEHHSAFDSVVTAAYTTGKLANVAKDREPNWIDRMLGFMKRGAEHGVAAVSDDFAEDPSLEMDVTLFFSCMSFLMCHDHCIITDEGYMGLAPECSQAGNRIAWINGLQSFVGLRRVAGQYQIVGLCFLHGIMHGELFNQGSFEEVFFEII